MITMTEVTTEALLTALATIPHTLRVDSEGEVRDAEGKCPICVIADEILSYPTGHRLAAQTALRKALGRKLSLAEVGEVNRFIEAADYRYPDPLREQLLEVIS